MLWGQAIPTDIYRDHPLNAHENGHSFSCLDLPTKREGENRTVEKNNGTKRKSGLFVKSCHDLK